jgi:predicted enzyme related to lactoylglutathione lyase
MERVTGIGGVFFKSKDPEALRAWYRDHLGLTLSEYGICVFEWADEADPKRPGQTVWSLFPADTKSFDPSPAPFMLNYRVRNLEAMLTQLRKLGAKVEEKVDDSEYGKFGWVSDPEGNRIELWEPPVTA